MSRIGKRVLTIPESVNVNVEDKKLQLKVLKENYH